MPQLGSFLIDHRSPLEQRWGGWYVTGTHGGARHMGTEGRADFSKGDRRAVLQETVDYLLFADEVKLTAPVRGGSAFSKTFGMTGPKDRTGRSLRELDLQSRLFKYRCSYMIYSPAFDALPAEARAAVFALMSARLGDRDTMAILDETKPGWR